MLVPSLLVEQIQEEAAGSGGLRFIGPACEHLDAVIAAFRPVSAC
jgi:hypothetical protein